MNNGRLYQNFNHAQRQAAYEIVNSFPSVFEDCENLLDVGCGPGDVLVDFVLPKLSKKCKVVGIDISDEMVEFATETFGQDGLEFFQADISDEKQNWVEKLTNNEKTFDLIASFYCFHWIQDQSRALHNLEKLLRPNGRILMCFLGFSPAFDIYKKLSTYNCYKTYMEDVDNYISPYHRDEDPLKTFRDHSSRVGLKVDVLELRDQLYIYRNSEILKNAVKSVNPFTDKMPEYLQDQFVTDYMKLVEQFTVNKNINSDSQIVSQYQMIVAVLSKKI